MIPPIGAVMQCDDSSELTLEYQRDSVPTLSKVLISLNDVIGNPSFSFSIFRRFKATISSVVLSRAL